MKRNTAHIKLLQKNKKYSDTYKNSALMRLLESKKIRSKKTRDALLACIQTLSDYFQKVVMLRNVFCDDPYYSHTAQEHLREEFLHNISLLKERKNKPAKWDPILESTSSWFAWKMFTLNEQEKTLLIQRAYEVMRKYGETDYFKVHSEADEEHEKMGEDLLKNVSEKTLPRMFNILQQGWDVMNAACNRIAEITHLT
jgi:hypothetical protein